MDQWFVKMKPLAKKAIEAVEEDEIQFFPERWKKVYLNWMNEIRDWCISRQLWWGHRIPVWYCDECGETIVSEEDPTSCPKCGSNNLTQDPDVLDTWFSSALWPFSTLGWPEKTEDVERFYPTGTLVTAFDIIFFWVARMIMMGEKFMGEKPFSHVFITPLVRDKKGRKMSKSLGNGVDPLDIIDKYGTDPMRFTLSILAAQGRDIKLDEKSFEPYSKFANKIWNATRFALLNLNDFESIEYDYDELHLEDKWILTRMNRAIKNVSDGIETYNFNHAAKAIYDFVWSELCDWYIESIKERLNSEGRSKKLAQNVLVKVFDNALRLLHPFMPYLSEELWQAIPSIKEDELLIISKWPKETKEEIFEKEENRFNDIMSVIRGIRNVKADMNIPQSQKIKAEYKILSDNDWIEGAQDQILKLANLENLDKTDAKKERSATAYVDENVETYVLLGDMIDVDAEKDRLNKKIQKLEKEVNKFEKKLNNKNFLGKADPEVVEEAKIKYEDAKYQVKKLETLIKEID
jgi:valyl-tRNA synthetase